MNVRSILRFLQLLPMFLSQRMDVFVGTEHSLGRQNPNIQIQISSRLISLHRFP